MAVTGSDQRSAERVLAQRGPPAWAWDVCDAGASTARPAAPRPRRDFVDADSQKPVEPSVRRGLRSHARTIPVHAIGQEARS